MTAPRFIILLGAPGAGKGTQAATVSQATGLVHVSTGELFRENLKNETELGLLAKGYMNKGQLVPDDVTLNMVRERILRPDCAAGALLDGFPRTLPQAVALEKALTAHHASVTAVLHINVPDEEVLRRLTSRWLCRSCGAIYNAISNPPKAEGVCDADGGELYQRDDDKPEAAKKRLEVYWRETAPLIGYYTAQGKIIDFDGTKDVDEVGRELVAALEAVPA